MIFKGKPTIDNLDFYLARREYDLALAAILQELKRQPRNSNLVLRQAEVLILMDDREGAIDLYRKLARDYTEEGFYARAIAVANKILRLDPNRTDITGEVAQLISSRQAADRAAREKLSRAARPGRDAESPGEGVSQQPRPGKGTETGRAEAGNSAEPQGRDAPAVQAEPATSQEERERTASQLFGALPQGALERLLSLTSVRSFAPGEPIVREGEPGTSLYLINEGHVDVETTDPIGREIHLASLGPGDFFGEVSVLTGKPRTATIVAREPVIVIEIGREALGDIIDEYPEVDGILRAFYERRAQATVDAMVARLRGEGG